MWNFVKRSTTGWYPGITMSSFKPKNQFPELPHLKGNHYQTTIRHGLLLQEEGVLVIPDFQRGLVWTTEQKVRFIESLVTGLPIGEYTIHYDNKTPKYELLDGQQRWNAIFSYVNGEFEVFGLKWSDLNKDSVYVFSNTQFPYREITGLTEEQKLDVYNRLAYGGTPHEIPT